MAFLQNEKARLQAEIQATGAEITNLTAQLQVQQQAIVSAQARVTAARSDLAAAQAQIPNLEAAAVTADGQVAGLDLGIAEHLRNEPPETIQTRPDKPQLPNPAWKTWNTTLDQLTQQLGQAQADAAAAHARLNGGRARVSQATAELQAAERQVAEATAAVQVTQLAIAAAHLRQETAQAQVANLDRWNDEIARDPLNRMALELLAAELSDRALALEDAHAVARIQNDIAKETLSSLSKRRVELTQELNTVNAQLPGASEDLRLANVALSRVTLSMRELLKRGPQA